ALTHPSMLWTKTAENTLPARPLNFDFVVTYYDPGWKVLWVQQDSQASFLFAGTNALPFKSGDHVRVGGFSVSERAEINWPEAQITVIGTNAWADPLVVTNSGASAISRDPVWIQIEGYITRSMEIDNEHWSATLRTRDNQFRVFVHFPN